MELEQAVLEAIKLKLRETFGKIVVTVGMEEKDILIRITLPDEIMNKTVPTMIYGSSENMEISRKIINSHLDKEAQAAADELLGNNQENE